MLNEHINNRIPIQMEILWRLEMKILKPMVFLVIITLLPLLIIGGQKVIIDIKVPIAETADLAPAQAGATVYLMQSDWAGVSEVNEDIAVWLTDYERKKNIIGQQVVSLTLELREPSSIRIGNLLERQTITVRYRISPSDTAKYDQAFLNDLDELSQELKMEAYFLGVKIEDVLKGLLD